MGALVAVRRAGWASAFLVFVALSVLLGGAGERASTTSFGAVFAAAVPLCLLLERSGDRWVVPVFAAFGTELAVRAYACSSVGSAAIESTQTLVHVIVSGTLMVRLGSSRILQAGAMTLIVFAAFIIIGAMCGASVGSLLGIPFGRSATFMDWQMSWLGDALGVAALLPVLLVWRRRPPRPRFNHPTRLAEASGLLFLWSAFAIVVGDDWSAGHEEVLFLLVPIFVWTSSRFGLAWGALGNLAFVFVASQSDILRPSSPEWALFHRGFVLMAILASLYLAVLLEERDRMLRVLETNKSRLWAVLASIPDIVLRVDREGRCLERLGATSFDPPGAAKISSVSALLPAEAAAAVRKVVREVVKTGTPGGCQTHYNIASRVRWVEARVAAVAPSTEGEERTAIVSLRDVTDEHLSQQRAAEADKARALQHLTGGVAHDFNNLLTTIIGNLDLLRMEITNADHLASLEDVSRAAARGRDLTQRLLAYSERQPLQPKATNIAHYLPGLLPRLEERSDVRVSFQVDVDGGGPWTVSVDADRLEKAVVSLVDNARDADAGSLTNIRLRLDRKTLPSGCEGAPVVYVRIAVEDDGEGMSTETLERACDPFFTTRGVGHTGLGLSMVRGFARQSGGHFRLRSRKNQGTQASLLLPLIEQADPAAVASDDFVPPERIVIAAHQDAQIRRVVVEQAIGRGYVPVEAQTIYGLNTLLGRWEQVALVVVERGLGSSNAPSQVPHLSDDQPCLTIINPSRVGRPGLTPTELGALGKEMAELLPKKPSSSILDLEESWPPIPVMPQA